MIKSQLEEVRAEITKHCKKVGRNDNEVTLIAVSKTKPITMLQEAYDAGVRDFGENKVQEIIDKYGALPEDIRWHMIGHLQRNKVKYIVDKVSFIHSVDSIRLADEIEKEAKKKDCHVDIFLEVNVSGEESKFGFTPKMLLEQIEKFSNYSHISVQGLMTIAPYTENSDENRCFFRDLRELSVDIAEKNIDNVNMKVLSMGMTGDYKVAIEEGSTMIRVGTGIFGARDYSKANDKRGE